MQDRKRKSKTAYCYRIASFPKEAYMNYVFYGRNEDIAMLYPFETVYPSIENLAEEMRNYSFEWNKEMANGMEIIDVSIIVPLVFHSLYPLRREFWNNPTMNFDDLDRFRGFWKAAAKPHFYKVVVTPQWLRKQVAYHAVVPFYITAQVRDIDAFMMHSDYPVDERAKYAAIYTIGTPLRFNWKTGELSQAHKFDKTPILN